MKYLNFIHKRPIWTIFFLFIIGIAVMFTHMFYLPESISKKLALKYADSYLIALNTFHRFFST